CTPHTLLLSFHVHLTHPFPSFFFNAPAPTEIYTLSLHDALPISRPLRSAGRSRPCASAPRRCTAAGPRSRSASRWGWRCSSSRPDRKSTRLNSSHDQISYAVFCLKKKKNTDHL